MVNRIAATAALTRLSFLLVVTCVVGVPPAVAEISYWPATQIDARGYVSVDQTNWVPAIEPAVEIHAYVGQPIYFKLVSRTTPGENISDIDSRSDPYYLGDTLHCKWVFDDGTPNWEDDISPLTFPYEFRWSPPLPSDYEWGDAAVPGGHTYTNPGTYVATWSVEDLFNYDGPKPGADDEPDPSGGITIHVHDVSRPLPTDNLNNAAGANRCNIRWANSDYASDFTVGYGDDFTMPSGTNWVIEKIRVWMVPSIPVWPEYFLGDVYQSVALYIGASGGTLAEALSGAFTQGTNATDNGNITVTPVSYSGGVHYEAADGRFNRIWQIDFNGLALEVSGGVTYVFGVHALPRVDRLCFVHATHGAQGGDGKIRRFDINNLSNGSTLVEDIDKWFGGKGSDINVQVFAHVVQ